MEPAPGLWARITAPFHRFQHRIGRTILSASGTIHGLGAFALITLGSIVTRFGKARALIRPMIRHEIHRTGVRLLPMILFLSGTLGLVVIGQTVALLKKVGAQEYIGIVMVTVVVRELGPIIAALLVLMRAGAANVVELGTARALGEVEALEALGIDPIHYLVVPRVVGMAVSIFGLTVYLIITAIVSGYLFAFLQDVPLQPAEYFNQIAGALVWQDFALIAFKTLAFGAVIAVVSSFHGLALPLKLEEVPVATTRAVGQSVVLCALLDAVFLVVYRLV
jgi:phospholipid/cholesterol/gamma-HCH transport system permease protein